jgi:hypothetical protein
LGGASARTVGGAVEVRWHFRRRRTVPAAFHDAKGIGSSCD